MNTTIARQLMIPTKLRESVKFCTPNDRQTYLRGLSNVNFIVGPNNSGKSRLLRSIGLQHEEIRYLADRESVRCVERVQQAIALHCATSPARVASALVDISTAAHSDVSKFGAGKKLNTANYNSRFELRTYAEQVGIDMNELWQAVHTLSREVSDVQQQRQPLRVYIPAIRTLRRTVTIPEVKRGSYMTRAEHAIYSSIVNSYAQEHAPEDLHPLSVAGHQRMVFTGEELFDLLLDLRLGSHTERELLEDYEQFLSQCFFRGERIELIPKRRDELVAIKEGGLEDRLIDQLGDGLQHLLILTLPLFLFRDKPLWLFIEEPELYLHPGQQRSLLEAWIARAASNTQIFATTHSQQFIDLTIDSDAVSILRVRRVITRKPESKDAVSNFEVDKWSNDDITLLGDLGVRSSSVLLVNATIWVEGITDRLYLRHFIDLLQKGLPRSQQMIEDTHYTFVEYGGSAITHWSFLDDQTPDPTIEVKRLCATLFLIADRPKKETAKLKARHKALQAVLKERYMRLNVMEIENILSPPVIAATVRSLSKEEVTFERPPSPVSYQLKKLGEFIAITANGPDDARNRFKGKGGAIKDKIAFCRQAIAEMENASLLSKEATDLTRKLLDFIRERNGFGSA